MHRTWRSAVVAVLAALATCHAFARCATAAPALSFPLVRTAWFWSSPPLADMGEAPPVSVPVFVGQHNVIWWYNARGVKEHDLDPALPDEEGGDAERIVLELNIQPPPDTSAISPTSWAGITLQVSTAGLDFTGSGYVAIWVNDFTPDHSLTEGKLHIDFGRVSEDAFWDPNAVPNGRLDTEDKNGNGELDRSGDLNLDEDTGLDGIHSANEPGYNAATNPDPNRDDYFFDPNRTPLDYSRINNTEVNGTGEASARPDTEDLNRDGFADFQNNDYFEATIDLSDTAFVAIDVPRDYAGHPNVEADNGWRLYRIPLTEDLFRRVNVARWENIQHMRLWINGLTAPRRIQIGGIELLDPLGRAAPRKARLHPNAPNPFNPGTTIRYELARDGPVRLRVYDARGRLVRVLYEGNRPAGYHQAFWNGEDELGRRAASGVYWYRLEASGFSQARKMVLAR